MLEWIACLIAGHRWTTLRVNPAKREALAQFHPQAGLDAQCSRCGKTWLDADDPYFTAPGKEAP